MKKLTKKNVTVGELLVMTGFRVPFNWDNRDPASSQLANVNAIVLYDALCDPMKAAYDALEDGE
jgi:hypothetical protein